jgi:hypothetical protein
LVFVLTLKDLPYYLIYTLKTPNFQIKVFPWIYLLIFKIFICLLGVGEMMGSF